MKARLADLGGTPLPVSPAQFGKLIVEETEKWGFRSLGISGWDVFHAGAARVALTASPRK
jgi:hypothetical protein